MLTPERKAELVAELESVNAALDQNYADENALKERKNALAKEILLSSILPSLHWSVRPDGETIVADEPVGIEVLILFGAQFHHERFNLTGCAPTHPDRVAHDLLAWLREKNLLAFAAADDPAMFGLFQESQSWFTDEVVVDEKSYVWANVDDTRLTISCLDTERLLAFVEEHHLDVQWDDAAEIIAAAQKKAADAAASALDVQVRLGRFLRPKVQDEGDPA